MEPSLQAKDDRGRVSKKRNRLAISCGHCRIRKLKCNRANPCESCVKSGDATTCSYVSNRPNVHRERNLSSNSPSRDALLNRIDRLEQLVISAMQPQPAQALIDVPQFNAFQSSLDSMGSGRIAKTYKSRNSFEIDDLATTFGIMKLETGKQTYLGGTHWVSIMSEIKEFRNHLICNVDEFERDAIQKKAATKSGKSSSLLLGTSSPKSREELFSSMPPRPVADQLITRCFEIYSCIFPIIHESMFRRQYNEHWEDPARTNVTWLAVLFGMLRLAEMSYEGTEFEISAMAVGASDIYKARTIDCLIAGDYTNPGDNTIEALLLYAHAEWLDTVDATIDLSVVISMIVRLAMRMGYHREPKAHFGLTSFQEEMRRRVWARLCIMDIQYSFQISLPVSVRSDECDSSLPRNIRDRDFDENTIDLPPPLPLSEDTEICYMIMKTRLTVVFGRILARTASSDTIDTETVMEYEQELHDIQRDMPPHLMYLPSRESMTSPLSFERTRMNLDRIYQAARCLLYRKFLRQDSLNVRYRGVCIDAAMILLNHHATIFLEDDLLNPLNSKQRHRSIFISHDFYVACMAIALDLHYGYELEPKISKRDIAIWGFDRRNEMINALQTSTEFWRLSREESAEAAKAYGLFSFVLQKVKGMQQMTGKDFSKPNALETALDYEAVTPDDTIGMEQQPDWSVNFDSDIWNSWKQNDQDFQLFMQ